jgi:hypothetical protein
MAFKSRSRTECRGHVSLSFYEVENILSRPKFEALVTGVGMLVALITVSAFFPGEHEAFAITARRNEAREFTLPIHAVDRFAGTQPPHKSLWGHPPLTFW